MLLQSLVSLGYLNYDPEARAFSPSYRVALLGESVQDRPILPKGPLTEALRALHERTRETVLVGLQNGAYVQYVHVLARTPNLLRRLPIGKVRLMAYNPLGEALLALLDDKRVTAILRHNNANWTDAETRATESTLWTQIRLARASGYAEGPGRTWPNAFIIATALRLGPSTPPLSIAAGGMRETILPQRQAIIDALLEIKGDIGQDD